MIISIVNRTETLSDEEVHAAIRAINKQIAYDFEPYWSFGAKLRLEGAVGKNPDKEKVLELRGDAIIYLWDGADVENALGYHDANNRGIPYGFVFTKLCKDLGENWTVTLSHEALELLGDAQGNLLVQGPHPEDPNKQIFHWFEMCDAVQAQTYMLDGVEVANFVLPLYFTTEEQSGGRNDFLGRLKGKQALKSFGVAPGGYIGFYDPNTQQHDTFAAADDKKAQRRIDIKKKYHAGRGFIRMHGDATLPKEQEHQLALVTEEVPTLANDPIRHVVVLMLENRSFDQMLGDTTRIYPDVEGIPQHGPAYSNVSTQSGKVYPQKPNAAAVVKSDPAHDLVDVLKQLGNAATSPMGGFVDSYLDVAGVSENTPGQVEQVMAYFPLGKQQKDDSLPALHALARNFLVCDHWFSSMPGPTWANRFFAHSGTSLGHVLMPSRQHPGNMRVYNQDTIYDRLGDFGTNWRIYFDGIPQSIVMTHLLPSFVFGPHYSTFRNFAKDAKGPEKKFPDYVFIEPTYFGRNENDQHPPSDVAAGDRLIAEVYNAIRSNEALWKSTLLIVTYDEHGGFFDHRFPARNDRARRQHQGIQLRTPRRARTGNPGFTLGRARRLQEAIRPHQHPALCLRQMGIGAARQAHCPVRRRVPGEQFRVRDQAANSPRRHTGVDFRTAEAQGEGCSRSATCGRIARGPPLVHGQSARRHSRRSHQEGKTPRCASHVLAQGPGTSPIDRRAATKSRRTSLREALERQGIRARTSEGKTTASTQEHAQPSD